MWDTAKAERIHEERRLTDAGRTRLADDKRTHPYSCYDCGGLTTIHKLRDEIWALAWPTYRALKSS